MGLGLHKQIWLGALLVLMTVLFHVTCIYWLVPLLEWVGTHSLVPFRLSTYIVMSVAVLGVLTIHGIEAWLWAAVYRGLGQFDDMETALYFSVVTTTTLGYGDFTLSRDWRVLASFQAIGGLILFGASTAFLFEIISRLFE
jgi:hypothetical protein